MQTIIDWIDPAVQHPPFNERIIVLLGGQGSRDCMKTWMKYVSVSDVVILWNSPNDDDDGKSQYDCWFDEDDQQAAYHNARGQGSAACGASPAPTGCAANGTNNERTEK